MILGRAGGWVMISDLFTRLGVAAVSALISVLIWMRLEKKLSSTQKMILNKILYIAIFAWILFLVLSLAIGIFFGRGII